MPGPGSRGRNHDSSALDRPTLRPAHPTVNRSDKGMQPAHSPGATGADLQYAALEAVGLREWRADPAMPFSMTGSVTVTSVEIVALVVS